MALSNVCSNYGPPDPTPSVNPPWLFGTIEDSLCWVLEQEPSADTMLALQALEQQAMTDAEQVLLAVAWERQVSSATAKMHSAISDATTSRPGGLPEDILEVEVGLAMRKSEQGAAMSRHFAHRLTRDLPVMFRTLKQGDATLAHARALDELTDLLDAEQTAKVDAEVSPRAATLTVPAFRRAVRRAVAAVDPDNARKRYERAKKEQAGARVYPGEDGMSTLSMTMPTTEAVASLEEINRRANDLRVKDDERTHGERQVQAFHDALSGRPATGTGEGKQRRRRNAQIIATIDLMSLIGLREEPGEVHGVGPVPAQAIRDLLRQEGSLLRRLVYDPVTGIVRDLAGRHAPDDDLRDILDVRDVTCRFPGCTRNAIWCECEHCVPFPDGPTTDRNCSLMCRRHHRRKTHDGFRYRRTDPESGETSWETPLGFSYRQAAASYDRTGRDTGDTVFEGLTSPSS